jgi:DNA-binding transcriptional MerR regulator
MFNTLLFSRKSHIYTCTFMFINLYVYGYSKGQHSMSNLFTAAELAQRTSVSERTMAEWESAGLLKPSAISDDHTPLFPLPSLERALMIKKFADMGYGLDHIKKIIRKVGLPQSATATPAVPAADSYLTVGVLAEKIGISTRTIKHWEDVGIIAPDMWSEAGFRLYSDSYIFLCSLIKDLQLFGYSLEEIKQISNYFRDFWDISNERYHYSRDETAEKLQQMLAAIDTLFDKMHQFRDGIDRWDKLLKKKRTEIHRLHADNTKRRGSTAGNTEKK